MKNYKAYIASTPESEAFDSAFGKTKESAIAAVKRKNSPDWQDCFVWCVCSRARGGGKGMKKAYEVVMAVTGSHKDSERIVFVEAESKRELVGAYDVKRVFTRPDLKPEDCPCEVVENVIVSK